MLFVELFSGTGSVGKEARRRGWDVISVDMDPMHDATYTGDVRKFPYKDLVPDLVWASPPCTTYSNAANWVRHREPGTGRALSAAAREADRLLMHTLKMIRYWTSKNPDLTFCIENPRGHMRQLNSMQSFQRTTTLYSYYGWPIRKPTDFWTNFPLTLKTSGKEDLLPIRVGKDPGWRRALREALGGGHESQAVVLGRIPPRLVRSILTQMSK
jgi:site-specific DNA-cytosine methylase